MIRRSGAMFHSRQQQAPANTGSQKQSAAPSRSSSTRTGTDGGEPACSTTNESSLLQALQKVDPVLQFLTKATGQTAVPAPSFWQALPAAFRASATLQADLDRLVELGILHKTTMTTQEGDESDMFDCSSTAKQTIRIGAWRWDDATSLIGFPPPDATAAAASSQKQQQQQQRLHGSTKAAAKRRAVALKKLLRNDEGVEDKKSPAPAASVVLGRPSNEPTQEYQQAAKSANNAAATFSSLLTEESSADTSLLNNTEASDGCSSEGRKAFVTMDDEQPSNREEKLARESLQKLFGFANDDGREDQECCMLDPAIPSIILPRQASYAGSNPAQESVYQTLSEDCRAEIPTKLWEAFGLEDGSEGEVDAYTRLHSADQASPQQQKGRRLYSHQVAAIEAAMANQHCSLCTGTGSGKSLAFLLPVLTAAYNYNHTSLLLFPTKALAQDQLSKLLALLARDSDLSQRIRPATLDGDTPHAARGRIGSFNVILTNPDTLHAAVLPSWKAYQSLLAALRYVVVDEAHTYDGIFGGHVAMVLRRLRRLCAVAAAMQENGGRNYNSPAGRLTFFSASATLPWPEHHFRLLCPVPKDAAIKVLTSGTEDDGSPRSAKHFFVWNPPVLRMDGVSTGKVDFPRPGASMTAAPVAGESTTTTTPSGLVTGKIAPPIGAGTKRRREVSPSGSEEALVVPESSWKNPMLSSSSSPPPSDDGDTSGLQLSEPPSIPQHFANFHRRHAADETARLLARAVAQGVRCIAFCKTRNLVEWVYSKTLDALQSDPSTARLASKVDSYRGGYSLKERRMIEERLFRNETLGVVGTNALELGVDIGGIDVTLHCGYPSSYSSLLQQAGRAGRDKGRLDVPSVSVVVCFNSPSEQQIWRRPKSLFGQGLSAPNTISLSTDLVQGHVLCASEEYPLTGVEPVTSIAVASRHQEEVPSDRDLFGPSEYDESLESLMSTGSIVEEDVMVSNSPTTKITVFKARPSVQKAWSRLSIRSIEPVNYAVVNISHPGQGGLMDGIHDTDAILDTLPYSRVFYHAHPGSIITHRARKYKIVAMTPPPAFVAENFSYRRSLNLAAYAKPTNARYLTRPLSNMQITIVKTLESVELRETSASSGISASPPRSNAEDLEGEKVLTFAGCGAVSVKREVHGYKKLSIINRTEISRCPLHMPSLEYDTFGLYLCAEPDTLAPMLGERYGPGVHALSHALLAVAPLFASGLTRGDLECDHSFYLPTQVVLFDERAGGSGCVQRLWSYFFDPNNNILEAAIDLLEACSSCRVAAGYDEGCPACVHASSCIKFNMNLSRSAAVVIGRRMLERIKQTDKYKRNTGKVSEMNKTRAGSCDKPKESTPRRKARDKAMRKAKEMHSARDRQFVIGRPTWPLDD